MKPYTHEDANTAAETERWHAAAARELSANLPQDLATRLQDIARNLEAHAMTLEERYVALARRSR
jgi:hypothetical protein